jgi:hypothetical protein
MRGAVRGHASGSHCGSIMPEEISVTLLGAGRPRFLTERESALPGEGRSESCRRRPVFGALANPAGVTAGAGTARLGVTAGAEPPIRAAGGTAAAGVASRRRHRCPDGLLVPDSRRPSVHARHTCRPFFWRGFCGPDPRVTGRGRLPCPPPSVLRPRRHRPGPSSSSPAGALPRHHRRGPYPRHHRRGPYPRHRRGLALLALFASPVSRPLPLTSSALPEGGRAPSASRTAKVTGPRSAPHRVLHGFRPRHVALYSSGPHPGRWRHRSTLPSTDDGRTRSTFPAANCASCRGFRPGTGRTHRGADAVRASSRADQQCVTVLPCPRQRGTAPHPPVGPTGGPPSAPRRPR